VEQDAGEDQPAAQDACHFGLSATTERTGGLQTLCWREMDSNFRFRRERTVFSNLGLLLARDRGVGADVSVQPGFVVIMPSRWKLAWGRVRYRACWLSFGLRIHPQCLTPLAVARTNASVKSIAPVSRSQADGACVIVLLYIGMILSLAI
jgi:hypothetical protein